MSKKYLSLEEAAQMLGISKDELNRLRERQEIRGFADRGTWKFKHEDIETLLRRRQADSDPEVPLMDDLPQAPSVGLEQDVSEQPTIIRRGAPTPDDDLVLSEPDSPSSPSDSDVRLVGGDDRIDFDMEGDSDVKLVGLGATISDNLGTDPEIVIKKPGSDSDVRLVRNDSDSDVKLAPGDSDSDVKLVGGETEQEVNLIDLPEGGTDQDIPQKKPIELSNSDSDVRLVADDNLGATVADVGLIDDDDHPIAINFNQGDKSSVLDEESGISLGRDSSLLLGESGISLAGPSDSGIALELNDDDSGISLALDDESGISLDMGESGISLDVGESGISLASDDDHGGTIPMMDIMGDDDPGETQFEVAAIADDSFDDLDKTGVMDALDDSASDAVFNLDDDAEVAEAFGEGDVDLDAGEYEDDLDVFGADEAAFEDSGVEAYGAPVVSKARNVVEAEWGTGTFVGLVLGSLLMLLCGVVMIDLVKNTASASSLNPVSGKVLELLGGLYK